MSSVVVDKQSSTQSMIVVGVSAAIAAGLYNWPAPARQSYALSTAASSYSYSDIQMLEIAPRTTSILTEKVTQVYQALLLENEPLGSEFEKVWDLNARALYEE